MALRKRAVAPDRIERMINGIVRQLESQGDADIPTDRIGELVMEGLKGSTRSPTSGSRRSIAISTRRAISTLDRRRAGTGPAGRAGAAAPGAVMTGPAREEDARWMDAALALGRRGLGFTAPNPSVGALIVRDGVVVGRGVTQPGGRPHAERLAIAEAGEAARGATLYVTLEPCSHHGVTPPLRGRRH